MILNQTKMRLRTWVLVGIAFLSALSCVNESHFNEEVGELSISLKADDLLTRTKASISQDLVPDLNDVKIEIFKWTDDGLLRLFRDTYGNVSNSEESIKLNCADYRLLASYGDSLAVGQGKPYFAGITDFKLLRGEPTFVESIVKVANVQVSVEYGENIQYDYSEYYVNAISRTKGGKKKTLEYYQDDDYSFFMPCGEIQIEVYAMVDGVWKYYASPAITALPGDDLNFKIQTKRLEADLNLEFVISQTNQIDKVFQVSSDMLPKEEPSIKSESASIIVTEGDAPMTDLKMDIVADGAIGECWLNINSAYLAAKGVPERVNLADANLDDDVVTALESVGVRWMKSMAGRRFAYVNFSGVTEYLSKISCDASNLFNAAFSLDVVDQRASNGATDHVGTVASESIYIQQGVPAPSVSVEGFENTIEVMEATGVNVDGMSATVTAKGRIASCLLYFDSKYLNAKGLTSPIDLATADASTRSTLNGIGITWPENISSLTSAVIDFSGVDNYMDGAQYNSSYGFDFASFSIRVENAVCVEDDKKNAESGVGAFKYIIPSSPVSGSIRATDIWAKRVKNYSATLKDGNMSQWKLQCSDGSAWKDVSATLNGDVLNCEKITGLSSGVTDGRKHTIRAIYHNNNSIAYNLYEFTTEPAAQVGNSDFEDWREETYSFKYKDFTKWKDATQKWYMPVKDKPKWWDVNSLLTMSKETATRSGLTYKIFPTVSYSTDTPSGSGKSAQMACIFVCNYATSGTRGDDAAGTAGSMIYGVDLWSSSAAGEIFIGAADDYGEHSTEGHEFYSRPDKISFQYKYAPYDNETFQVTAWILGTSGEEIATAETTSGPASSSWATYNLNFEYSNVDEKAAVIYIMFRASSKSNAEIGIKTGQTINMAGTNYGCHMGSLLKVDNLQLIYE